MKELYSLTDADSEEHYHLDGKPVLGFSLVPSVLLITEKGINSDMLSHAVAMKAMNKVASHINEMQKLHEEYGAVFDQLINEQTGDKKEVKLVMLSLTNVRPG